MSRLLRILVCAASLGGAVLHAQVAPAQPDATPAPSAPSASAPAIDPTKLGVSFERVRIELAQPVLAKTRKLKIQETIEVVGKAPPIQLWDPRTVKAELTSKAVPYGAPTQADIMKLIVPKEFQTYPMDLNALMQWLMEHLNKKAE